MEKVLLILSDNNKGKFISKGFASAFREMSYFVYERKVCDLNIGEINKISPDIVFIFWTDLPQKQDLLEIFNNYNDLQHAKYIHCAELANDIPSEFKGKKSNYVFFSGNKNKQYKFLFSVNAKEYRTNFSGYKYTITFAGNPAYKTRENILAKLIYNFGSVNLFCRSGDFYKSVDDIYKSKLLNEKYMELYQNSYKGYAQSIEELSRIYVSSRVNIDMLSDKKKYMNYRFLEILASGGLLIAPYNQMISKYFEDGHDYDSYNSDEELIDKIRFYLNNSNISQLIAANGKRNAVSNNSFNDRLKKMLKVVYGENTCSR